MEAVNGPEVTRILPDQEHTSQLNNAPSFSKQLAEQLDETRLIWVPDKNARRDLSTRGYWERSVNINWNTVMDVTEAIFDKPIFEKEKVRFFEAGCLFVALCIRRAGIEEPEGGFLYTSLSKILGREIPKAKNSNFHEPIAADHYLGFAWMCFTISLRFPYYNVPVTKLEEIPDGTLDGMIRDQQPDPVTKLVKKEQKLCIETAENLKADASKSSPNSATMCWPRALNYPRYRPSATNCDRVQGYMEKATAMMRGYRNQKRNKIK